MLDKKTRYVIIAVAVMTGAILLCWGIMALTNPKGNPAPVSTSEQIDWHEDCDEEDKRNKEWDECWAELLKEGKVRTPAPKATVARTGGPAVVVPAPKNTSTRRRP